MPDQPQRFEYIGTRGVVGMFFLMLEQYAGQSWIGQVANIFDSNQSLETYAGLGMVPQLREWIGAKHAKGFNEFSITIKNKDFEATLAIKNKDLRRDKTGQLRARIAQFAQRVLSHEALLLSGIIDGGSSTTVTIPGMSAQTIACYDGQPLFSDSHLIGSTSIDNNITIDLSDLSTALGSNVGVGTSTAPLAPAMAAGITAAVSQMYGFKDDQGQPLNEFARKFIVMVPNTFSGAAQQATKGQFLALGYANPTQFVLSPSLAEAEFMVVPNPRLTWTTQFAVFRADAPFKALIHQYEALNSASDANMSGGSESEATAGAGVVMKTLGPGSDHEFLNGEQLFGIEKSGNVGWSCFEQAVLVTFQA